MLMLPTCSFLIVRKVLKEVEEQFGLHYYQLYYLEEEEMLTLIRFRILHFPFFFLSQNGKILVQRRKIACLQNNAEIKHEIGFNGDKLVSETS